MRILRGSADVQPGGPFAVAIGIFDAVHPGHQALLRVALERAAADGIESLAYSFHPHPARVLAPAQAPALIESTARRLQRFAAAGLAAAVLEPFDRAFAAMEAEQFVREILVGRLAARHVIVGAGFRFGRQQRGDVELLRELGGALGFQVAEVGPVMLDAERISSTRIRAALSRGDVSLAGRLLARPYSLRGAVIHGAGRGGRIGFPTANIVPDAELWPAPGVYAGRLAQLDEQGSVVGAPLPAVVNIGSAPTFGREQAVVEAHALRPPDGPLYDRQVDLQLIQRLRDVQRFADAAALTAQIGRDIADAQGILAGP